MTSSAGGGSIYYWFPLLMPLFVAALGLVLRLNPGARPPLREVLAVHVPVTVMFSCVSIDIWGVTTMAIQPPAENGGEVLLWFLFLFVHLVVYGIGLLLERTIVGQPVPSMSLLAVPPVLALVAFGLAWWARHRIWFG